ncbi:chaperonin: PROVISIONAL [Gigaspora margarita]|uniref:Chaperonin: PROVISIONAL n=1 Tax=Gigaspora margarita TaxID=4874 RepID=A0A8H4ABP6_GIGMA|nr:chaperonin: PROVISIONAL [Gigaspora margarita]
MLQPPTVNDFRPVYNLVELELEDHEENELVLDTIHDLKSFFQNSNNSLEERELELFVKSQLTSFEISNEKEKNKIQKHTYRYNYNYFLPLCRPAYLELCGINNYLLSILQNHLQSNGLTERVYGNSRRASKTKSRVFLDLSIILPIKQFLVQYGMIHGLPSPLQHQDDSVPRTSDLCEVCTSFKAKLLVTKQNVDEYNEVQAEYNKHKEAADLERKHYNNNIEESKNNPDIAHICYDWAQSVHIPFLPQQVGSLYFKSSFSVNIFGVCKTGEQNYQLNFLMVENEFLKEFQKVLILR